MTFLRLRINKTRTVGRKKGFEGEVITVIETLNASHQVCSLQPTALILLLNNAG